jgi:hypothetical protein
MSHENGRPSIVLDQADDIVMLDSIERADHDVLTSCS